MINNIKYMSEWLRRNDLTVSESKLSEGYVAHLLDFSINNCSGTLYKDRNGNCKVLNLVNIALSGDYNQMSYTDICKYLKSVVLTD